MAKRSGSKADLERVKREVDRELKIRAARREKAPKVETRSIPDTDSAMIIGEASEAHIAEAEELLSRVSEEIRIGVAELLAYASRRKKFDSAVRLLNDEIDNGRALTGQKIAEIWSAL